MTNIYSLADYVVTLKGDRGNNIAGNIPEISIGGPAESTGLASSGNGSGFIGSITISREPDAWTLEGDVTGGFVHNRNLSRIGTVNISINQVSDKVRQLKTVMNIVEKTEAVYPFNITVTNAYTNEVVASCTSCLIRKTPNQVFGERATMQEWVFNAGVVEFKN